MQYKTRLLLLIFFISFGIHSDNFKFNTINNHGSVGLINMPSARFYDGSSIGLTLYRGDPDQKISLSLMPFDWLEASVFYTSIAGMEYGNGFKQNYKDKGFNIKFRIKQEGNFPALAIGANDFAGTGLFSSEYIVATQGFGNTDFTFGLGWGELNGKNHFRNPFIYLSQDFEFRSPNFGLGGELNDVFFKGKNISFFGGIVHAFSDNYLLKIEYDSTKVPGNIKYNLKSKPISISLESIKSQRFNYSISYEKDNSLNFKISLKDNFLQYDPQKYKRKNLREKNKLKKLRYILNANNIGVNSISQDENMIFVEVTENSYKSLSKIRENIDYAKDDAGLLEEVIVSYKTAGLTGMIDSAFKKNDDKYFQVYNKQDKVQLFSTNKFSIYPFLASREEFFKASLLLESNTELILREDLFISANLKYSLINNFDDLSIPPKDTYPNQVRSDIKEYLKNFNGRPLLGRLQLDYFKSIESNHFQFTAGILEDMFSGIGENT